VGHHSQSRSFRRQITASEVCLYICNRLIAPSKYSSNLNQTSNNRHHARLLNPSSNPDLVYVILSQRRLLRISLYKTRKRLSRNLLTARPAAGGHILA